MPAPESQIIGIGLLTVTVLSSVVFFRWLFAGPRSKDPWGEQISTDVESPEATPVCHRCLSEHDSLVHFCPRCGAAVGECNNVLPFEQLFSEGEVFRNGTSHHLPRRPLIVSGYVLLSLAAYSIFAPVYLYFFFRNLLQTREPAPLEPLEPESAS
jgi:hypothetical protein